jgi:hypothetical protein
MINGIPSALAKEPNVLRKMDSVGHKLSCEGIEVLREVQKKNMPFDIQTILPSKSSLSRIGKIVEKHGMGVAPCSLNNLPTRLGGGEIVKFKEEDVLPIVLKATKLDEAAQQGRVQVPCSSDTTRLSKNIQLMLFGMKIVDKSACCPLSNRPLFVSKTND